jgi:hypothetical protein
MRGARVPLAAGLIVLAVAVAVVLSGSPQVVAGSNAIDPLRSSLGSTPGAASGCQADETLPAGSTGARLSLEASSGPRVAVSIRSGGILVAHGVSAPGWVGEVVTIPLAPLSRPVRHATVCFAFSGADERVSFLGARSSTRTAADTSASALPGRISIEYTRPGSSSWWSLAHSVTRRMGLGRAWPGAWVAVLVALLMATGVVLASWLTIRVSR